MTVIKRGAAFDQDVRYRGESQHVVDYGRAAEQSLQRGQRRLGADLTALALDRVEHRGFFAADIGPRPDPDLDHQGGNKLCREIERRIELGNGMRIFAAHVDVTATGSDCMRGDCQAFDQLKRIAFHQHPVSKSAAIALIRVADDILLRARGIGDGLPLDPGRKARPAPPAQPRLGHFVDQLFRQERARAGQPGPAAGRGIVIKAKGARFTRARKSQALLMRDEGMIGDCADAFVAGS